MKKSKPRMEIEIKTLDGRVYRQPDCRLKVSQEGGLQFYIRKENGKWRATKGQITIKDFVLRREIKYQSIGKTLRYLIYLLKLKIKGKRNEQQLTTRSR